ncbi:hypothetical protein BDU57DRAFT_537447 [Ampelomyces quisqualis]|uniref:Uncharacterized protein n=1 Tax=Ampelomyces quisqualis TaxID=50730 RepID=A0A6A5QSH3_AMPQU|nr:hypothetical protein BDU57DRAFT_537447 [Ampelomyces quisqualis]
MSVAGASDGLNDVYEALEQYSWGDDVEFQSGLRAILGSNSTPEQAAELALRARCFYYARKFNVNIDFDGYKSYRNARGRPPPTRPTNGAPAASETGPPAPYPTSFAHVVELITSGQPVPGIKEIPPTVLQGQGTEPGKARRKKPWEKDESTAEGMAALASVT